MSGRRRGTAGNPGGREPLAVDTGHLRRATDPTRLRRHAILPAGVVRHISRTAGDTLAPSRAAARYPSHSSITTSED